MTIDCINCDFMNAADINPKDKKIIKTFAETNALKIPRPYGWPEFVRFHPYKMQWHITDKPDEQAITEALLAATYITNLVKEKNHEEVGFEFTETYPTEKGGKTVPYLIPQADGSYQLSTTKLPALCKDIYPKALFENDVLSHRVKNLQSSGTLQCQFIHIPTPINAENDMPPVYPALLLCVDSSNGCIIPVPVTEYLDNSKQLLSDFANTLCSSFGHPSKIFVRDDLTKNLLEDFCHKCHIDLKKKNTSTRTEYGTSRTIEPFYDVNHYFP